MKKAEIYYFTGTGNSLAVARDIGGKINAGLIPAASLVNKKKIETDSEIIGFVFPVYDFKPPEIIKKILEKMENLSSKYIFAVCTYGIMPLNVMKKFSQIIASSGGALSGGFTVKMPHNGLGSGKTSKKENEKMYKKWKSKLDKICTYIKAGEKGKIEKDNFLTVIFNIFNLFKYIPLIISIFREVSKGGGWNSLALNADEKCSGCGICQKSCPVDNIKIIDEKPVWGDNCEGCFACLHWCPEEAVQAGKITIKMKRYHHPDIGLSDILRQKTV